MTYGERSTHSSSLLSGSVAQKLVRPMGEVFSLQEIEEVGTQRSYSENTMV